MQPSDLSAEELAEPAINEDVVYTIGNLQHAALLSQINFTP